MRSFAAGSALAAAFVGEEPATVVQKIDHRVGFVEHHRACGAQPKAIDLQRTGEIQRRVKFVGRHHAGAQSAGHDGLDFATFPHAAAELLDQLPAGDAQRGFVTARPIDVAAKAVQFRAIAAGIARIVRAMAACPST